MLHERLLKGTLQVGARYSRGTEQANPTRQPEVRQAHFLFQESAERTIWKQPEPLFLVGEQRKHLDILFVQHVDAAGRARRHPDCLLPNDVRRQVPQGCNLGDAYTAGLLERLIEVLVVFGRSHLVDVRVLAQRH